MADLSSLNPANPADGEAVSQGASRIRDLVTATQTSMDVEHTLAGIHSFINGAPASRPAASTSGRLFIDTTNNRVERDTGSAWAMLNAVSSTYATGGSVVLTGTYQTLCSVTPDGASGSACLVLWVIQIASNPAGEPRAHVLFDSVEAAPGVAIALNDADGAPFTWFGWAFQPAGFAAGPHAITLQAFRNTASGVTASSSAVACFFL